MVRFSKSAIQDCLLKFLNLSGRKTCQGSRVASLVFTQSVGCESRELKVWKGQVNRGFRSRFKFAALRLASSKAT
ncbi:hypothetical protein FORC18_1232 [Vibrio parahaemolyticus]|nr:hypothetical protein FORC8_1231 [Vibrio parahaemolyticus]APE83845.1 hypothetical protein FORC18_1232 [Vibrio parahaemolyticus]